MKRQKQTELERHRREAEVMIARLLARGNTRAIGRLEMRLEEEKKRVLRLKEKISTQRDELAAIRDAVGAPRYARSTLDAVRRSLETSKTAADKFAAASLSPAFKQLSDEHSEYVGRLLAEIERLKAGGAP